MAFKGAAGMTDRYIKKLPNRAAKKPRYKPLPARRRKKLKTVHQTGGVLEIGSLSALQLPEGAFQRFPIGTALFRKKWSRFDETNVRYYLYEDHFCSMSGRTVPGSTGLMYGISRSTLLKRSCVGCRRFTSARRLFTARIWAGRAGFGKKYSSK